MNLDMDRLALFIGRLVIEAQAAGQQIEKLTKELEEAKQQEDPPGE